MQVRILPCHFAVMLSPAVERGDARVCAEGIDGIGKGPLTYRVCTYVIIFLWGLIC